MRPMPQAPPTLERSTRAHAMRLLAGAAVLPVALTLAGCLPDRAADMAACQAEAARFYPSFRVVDPDDPGSRFIIGCMATKGYDFSVTLPGCSSAHPLPTQAACYTSGSWVEWMAERLGAR